jgi:hypothetical protein
MNDNDKRQLACGCTVETKSDFVGRVVGTITERGAGCRREEHTPGHVLVMPGREHARPQDR